jgi:pSer/pThr/pTyr-binding forkhead associated (FHA) protein
MDVNLVLLKKNGSQKVLPLPSSVTVIGRRHNCDLRIPLMSVSKRHCQLHNDNGVWKVRDLGSRNGIRLNGMRVDEAAVKAGDSIAVGPLTFIFQIDGQPENITQPVSAAKSSTRQNTPKEDAQDAPTVDALDTTTDDALDEQFDSFADLDEADSAEGSGSFVDLDDIDSADEDESELL